MTNGRSSSETIVYIRGRLKPISPRTRLREGGRAVSFGIRSLIAERGREGREEGSSIIEFITLVEFFKYMVRIGSIEITNSRVSMARKR